MSSRSLLTMGSAIVVGALLAGAQLPAVAGSDHDRATRPFEVTRLKAISRATPFAGGCPGADLDSAHIAGYETEPTITVNPRKPHNIIASWMQDAGPGVAARSDLIASSRDLGKKWKRSTIPGLTACTGGTADAAADPWLSAGVDGTVYFVGAGASFTAVGRIAEILASPSDDRGRTWADAAAVAVPDARNDKPAITADPVVPGRAYSIWANWDMQLNFPFANLLEFTRTRHPRTASTCRAPFSSCPTGPSLRSSSG